MNGDDNPETATAPEPAPAGSPVVLPLKEMGKTPRDWTLTLYPGHLALADAPGAQPYIILREQIMRSVVLMEATRALAVQQPRKLIFVLTRPGVTALANWIGKPFLASFYMKRRYAWILPWAFLWVFGSLASLLPASRGVTTPKFDAVGLVLGLILMAAWALAKWRPHPALFLVDSIWFFWVSLNLTFSVVDGRSKGWLVLVALLAWMAATGFKHFLRFRGTRMGPAA